MISREMIQERLVALEQQADQLIANLNAIEGGKQTLQNLLAEIDKLEANPVPKVKRTRKPRQQKWLSPSLITDKKDEPAPTPASSAN